MSSFMIGAATFTSRNVGSEFGFFGFTMTATRRGGGYAFTQKLQALCGQLRCEKVDSR